MKWTECPAGTVNGANQRFLTALGDKADTVLDHINADDLFSLRLAQFAINGGQSLSVSQRFAKTMMGNNFLGIDKAIEHLGASPSLQQNAQLSEVPFSGDILHACRNSHALVAVLPLSIMNLKKIKKVVKARLFYPQDWYESESFARAKGVASWELIRIDPIDKSRNKSWDEQRKMVLQSEYILPARTLIYATLLSFYATGGTWLLGKNSVRCSDKILDNQLTIGGGRGTPSIFVGSNGRDGDNLRSEALCIMTAKKHSF